MTLLHPAFLWLAPLLAAPILIHLLNRLRYRRVRWAAIDFLLASERRAVRRARLRHLLLMALRILLLAAALLALAQPVFRGRLSGLLGGSNRVAVLLDSSASMAASDVSGSAFERARKLADQTLAGLPRGCRVNAATFAARYSSPFEQPLLDRRAVASLLSSAELTSGPGNVPEAIRSAAQSLARGGGGGTIWLLSDLQAAGWRAGDDGAWHQVRQALADAGDPRIIVTDLAPAVDRNLAVASVRLDEPVLLAGDEARLIVTVQLYGREGSSPSTSLGTGGAKTTVSLFLDDGAGGWQQVDLRSAELAGPGRLDIPFRLPTMPDHPLAGYVQLAPDAMPGDDRHYFLLRPSHRARVLVLDGASGPGSSGPGNPGSGGPARSGDASSGAGYLAWALAPGESELAVRSPFEPRRLGAERLAEAGELSDYAAVLLTDVPRLAGEWADRLAEYVQAGGLLIVFPGAHTQLDGWNGGSLLADSGVRLASLEQFETAGRAKLVWASPTSPITARLVAPNLDRVVIDRIYRIEADGANQVLATAGQAPGPGFAVAGNPGGPDKADPSTPDLPFLVRMQRGRGKIYLYAVSAERDFSSLPDSPVLLVTLHQAIRTHLTEVSAPLSGVAFEPLRLNLSPGACLMFVPGGPGSPGSDPKAADRPLPIAPLPDNPGQAIFDGTAQAGIYRLLAGDLPDPANAAARATPVAAVNPPAEESDLERIAPETIRRLMGDSSVYFTSAQADAGQVRGDDRDRVSASGFPLAVPAILFLLAEVLLGWSLGRPASADKEMQNAK